MAGYDDHQTEEEYIAASKRPVESEMDTKELVERLATLKDGFDTAIATVERLERERDEARREVKEWMDAAHLSACEAHSGLLEETEAEAAALRARVERLEEALKYIKRRAGDRSEKAWFRLDMIEDEADAALTEEPTS